MTCKTCLRCIEGGRTCCSDPRITPLISEIITVSIDLGIRPESFVRAYPYKGEGSWCPGWDEAMIGKVDQKPYELVFKRKPDGTCIFLNAGCSLTTKPIMCELFPLWAAGKKVGVLGDVPVKEYSCLMKNFPVHEVLSELDTTREKVITSCRLFTVDEIYWKKERVELIRKLVVQGLIQDQVQIQKEAEDVEETKR